MHTFCNLNTELLADLMRRFSGSQSSTDFKQVLANPEIDGVVIATREDMHVPLVKNIVTPESARKTVKLVRAEIESVRSGKTIDL